MGFIKSEFARGNPTKAKTACNEAVFKNGAQYCAVIGLVNMKNLRNFHIKFHHLMTTINRSMLFIDFYKYLS